MKRHLLFLIAAMLFSITTAFAQGGTTGTLTWNIDDGKLTISGNGAMPDYLMFGMPWFNYREMINTVILESGVTSIGDRAFQYHTNLALISIPNSLESIGEFAFSACYALTSITIPNSIISIKYGAFTGSGLTSISIPGSVTSIGNSVFQGCTNLSSVIISNGVTYIGDQMFMLCTNLSSIILPNSLTNIKYSAFSYCTSLTSIIIPNSVTDIGGWAFENCTSLTSIIIPASVICIGNGAFNNCTSLTSIDVESENKNYASENGVLFNKNKTSLICCPARKTGEYVIPNSVTSIDNSAFSVCTSLTSITIPNNVIDIGTGAFSSCAGLTSITIPNNITTIKAGTFELCTNLSSVTIPSGVKSIEDAAFRECINLTLITNLNPVPVELDQYYHYYLFYGINISECTLKVPIGSVEAYKNAAVWKDFNIVGINVGIETIKVTVNIYPNPTAGELRIESGELRVENVVIYDVFGKIQRIENWKMKNTIDISHLPTGVYFVKISTEAGEVTRKVVKEW